MRISVNKAEANVSEEGGSERCWNWLQEEAAAENLPTRKNTSAGSDRILSRKVGRNLPLFYIAAMIPRGEETRRKIERHRKMRETKGFQTLEWYTDIAGKIREKPLPENACVLLECLSNLTANEIYEPEGAGKKAADAVAEGVRMLQKKCAAAVVVTNEVFSEVPLESKGETDEMTEYKKILGEINRTLAETADQVTEVVCGIPCGVRGGQKLKLVTGGAFQGKYAWASAEYPGLSWTDGGSCSLDEIHTFQGMNRFHLFIRRWLESGRERRTDGSDSGTAGRDCACVG